MYVVDFGRISPPYWDQSAVSSIPLASGVLPGSPWFGSSHHPILAAITAEGNASPQHGAAATMFDCWNGALVTSVVLDFIYGNGCATLFRLFCKKKKNCNLLLGRILLEWIKMIVVFALR